MFYVAAAEDVDLYDPRQLTCGPFPHELFATLRREAPVYWHEEPTSGGFWCVTRHADIVAVNRDCETVLLLRGRRWTSGRRTSSRCSG